MKPNIHPEYHNTTVTCSACGNEFETGSTKQDIKIDTCSNCHPFYTGRQRFAQAAGRIERFQKRYGMANEEEAE